MQHFADRSIAERGVRYRRVALIPTSASTKRRPNAHLTSETPVVACPFRFNLGSDIILRHTASSVQTLKLTNVFGPNVWVIGTSDASRPCAIRTRPILGTLLRGSKVRQCPPR